MTEAVLNIVPITTIVPNTINATKRIIKTLALFNSLLNSLADKIFLVLDLISNFSDTCIVTLLVKYELFSFET